MITKERLEDLIEQDATIYEVKYNNINPVSLKNKIRFISEKNSVIVFEPRKNEKYKHHKYFKNLFETLEEAEWYLKYDKLQYTEKFNPSYYENIDLNYCYDYRFICKNHHEFLLRVSGPDIILFWLNTNYKEYYKNTKENYEKLIERCAKLFLGD